MEFRSPAFLREIGQLAIFQDLIPRVGMSVGDAPKHKFIVD